MYVGPQTANAPMVNVHAAYLVSSFEFQAWFPSFGSRDSGFGSRVSGSGFEVSGLGFEVYRRRSSDARAGRGPESTTAGASRS